MKHMYTLLSNPGQKQLVLYYYLIYNTQRKSCAAA